MRTYKSNQIIPFTEIKNYYNLPLKISPNGKDIFYVTLLKFEERYLSYYTFKSCNVIFLNYYDKKNIEISNIKNDPYINPNKNQTYYLQKDALIKTLTKEELKLYRQNIWSCRKNKKIFNKGKVFEEYKKQLNEQFRKLNCNITLGTN